jgi:hypothetical protein
MILQEETLHDGTLALYSSTTSLLYNYKYKTIINHNDLLVVLGTCECLNENLLEHSSIQWMVWGRWVAFFLYFQVYRVQERPCSFVRGMIYTTTPKEEDETPTTTTTSKVDAGKESLEREIISMERTNGNSNTQQPTTNQ